MSKIKTINILLNRKRISTGLLCSLAFLVYGIWNFPSIPSTLFKSNHVPNVYLIDYVMSVIPILMGLLGGYFYLKKLFDWNPGLILDSAGITDNSSGVAAGFIPWSEIIGFTVFEIYNQWTLFVVVRNPHRYINNARFVKRFFYKLNLKTFGTPIGIAINTLKIDPADLQGLCNKCLESFEDLPLN